MPRRLKCLILGLAACVPAGAGAQITPAAPPAVAPSVTTSGEGRVTLPPSRARIMVAENRRIVDFEATAWIEAIVRQLPRLGEVLDAVLRGGATSVDNVQFEADSLDAGRRRALAAAYRAAELDAQALAAATGRTLGPLVALSSAGGDPRPLAYMDMSGFGRNAGMGEVASSAVPAPQNIEVVARISGQWQLRGP